MGVCQGQNLHKKQEDAEDKVYLISSFFKTFTAAAFGMRVPGSQLALDTWL